MRRAVSQTTLHHSETDQAINLNFPDRAPGSYVHERSAFIRCQCFDSITERVLPLRVCKRVPRVVVTSHF